jgi:hypothetical protein
LACSGVLLNRICRILFLSEYEIGILSLRAVPPIAKVEIHYLLCLISLVNLSLRNRSKERTPLLIFYDGDLSPTTTTFVFEPRRTSGRILIEYNKRGSDLGRHYQRSLRASGLGMSVGDVSN